MPTLPCLVISEGEPESLPEDPRVREALQAGIVELRLDLLPEMSAETFRGFLDALGPENVLVTYRHVSEGGGRKIPEPERLEWLCGAVRAGVRYVDLELARAGEINRLKRECSATGGKTRIILSMHDFDGFPVNLDAVVREMAAAGADIGKIAVTVSSQLDNLRLFDLLRNSTLPLVVVGMGRVGLPGRILAAKYGMPFTYCSPDGGKGTAPGQPTFSEALATYRLANITKKTAVYGVLGNPVAHSMSPAMHNAAFRTMGFDAVYLAFHVDDDPVTVVRELSEYPGLNARGFSVTIPHKVAIMSAADELEAAAERIGAINTLVPRETGGWKGYNTDAAAAIEAIENAGGGKSSLKGKRAVVLGAGGTARAIALMLADRKVEGWIANRTESRGRALAESVGFRFTPLNEVSSVSPEILANTTSVGMSPNAGAMPVSEDSVPGEEGVVFDAVYNPRETRLLAVARKKGAKVVDGVEMFVGQGARQFRLWFGIDAPKEIMERVVVKRLSIDD